MVVAVQAVVVPMAVEEMVPCRGPGGGGEYDMRVREGEACMCQGMHAAGWLQAVTWRVGIYHSDPWFIAA